MIYIVGSGCLPTTTAELACDGDRMAYKAQNIYCLALCRKSVPTPGPEPEERDREPPRERQTSCPLAPLFIYFFFPLCLPYVN